MNTVPPSTYQLPGTTKPAGQRRSLEGIASLVLVLAALPAGLVVNVGLAIVRSNTWDIPPLISRLLAHAPRTDQAGFGTLIILAICGTGIGMHARYRIGRSMNELLGITTATLAFLIGVCILLGSLIVVLKMLTAPI